MFSVYKFYLVNHRHVLLNSCWQLPLLQQLMMKQVNISILDCPEAGLDANSSYLFGFDTFYRIGSDGLDDLEADREDGYQQGKSTGGCEDPGAERDAVTEVGEPVAHDVPRERNGYDERQQQRRTENAQHQYHHLARC